MNQRRIEELAECARSYAFQLLDAEIALTGSDAGQVAAAVERAFLAAMDDLYEQ